MRCTNPLLKATYVFPPVIYEPEDLIGQVQVDEDEEQPLRPGLDPVPIHVMRETMAKGQWLVQVRSSLCGQD